jgi:hypothetical protein
VIVVAGSANDDRLSQVAASATPPRVSHPSPNAIARCLCAMSADYTKVPGSRFRVPGSRCFEPELSNQNLRTRTLNLELWNLEPVKISPDFRRIDS